MPQRAAHNFVGTGAISGAPRAHTGAQHVSGSQATHGIRGSLDAGSRMAKQGAATAKLSRDFRQEVENRR